MLLMLLVSLVTANAKCEWKSIKITQRGDRSNYLWILGGDVFKDTCVKYDYSVTDLATGQTLSYLWKHGLVPRINFKYKGEFRFNLMLSNKCTGCDTVIYDYVTTYGYFTQCQLSYTLGSTYDPNCLDSLSGQMTKATPQIPEYCWTYMTKLYFADERLNKMSDSQWVHGTDSAIWEWTYHGAGDRVVYFKIDSMDDARFFNYKFTKPGRYVLVSSWMNWCFGNDTNMLRRFTIDPCVTLGASDLKKPEPKLIGTYDMMGRPVKYIRKDEIIIFLYDDGSTRKIIQN